MLRIQAKHDRSEIFLALIGALVISLVIIVLTGLVIIPYQVGFVMIIVGLVTVYIGLSRLSRKIDSRRLELKK
ncbi:MAG: hypothetical protein HY223_04380 [Thaumarchaeota archaeon]|nr:hypothetical protein [Nitrososphaerota archaeon]